MREDLIIQRVREGIAEWGEKPVAERIEDMVDRGVIDKDGNVLLRMPSGPKKDLGSTSVRSAKGGSVTIRSRDGTKKKS